MSDVDRDPAIRLHIGTDHAGFALARFLVSQPQHEGVHVVDHGAHEHDPNLVRGIRAALVWNRETARLARAHNDANVMALGARQHSEDEGTGTGQSLPGHAVLR
jgi:ribose 5-phosphate isomerase B